jgi:hypothetical protein
MPLSIFPREERNILYVKQNVQYIKQNQNL